MVSNCNLFNWQPISYNLKEKQRKKLEKMIDIKIQGDEGNDDQKAIKKQEYINMLDN